MIQIPLTQGKVALIDDCDSHLAEHKWYFDGRYVTRNTYKNCKQRKLKLHREILNAPKGIQVDHINGDKLDNRRDNLRLATQTENNQNRNRYANNTSGYKGVTWNKGKWRAQLTVNGKKIHLGLFDSKIDAALAYDQAAKQLHGEFAKTNFSIAAFAA